MKRHLLISLFCVLALCSCRQAQLKRVRVAPEGVSVKVQKVEAAVTVSTKHYVGSIEPAREASVNASASGTVTEILVKEGRRVQAGTVLAKISSQSIKSAYDASQATLAQARDAYERVKKVYGTGSVPQVKMVELETKLSQAKASAAAAADALEQCKVRAPFSGEVSSLNINKGEKVVIGQRLLSIVDAGGLEAGISVPENEVCLMGEGAVAKVYVPALDKTFAARIKTKAVVANSLSHSYRCTLAISDAPAGLLPGMVCKVYMDSDNASGIIIPSSVVKMDGEGRYVWTVSDGVVCKTRIETSGFSGKGVIVASGLAEGDMVIVEGASKVSSGMKVNVK